MKKILAFVLVLAMLLPVLGVAEIQSAVDEAYENGKAIETILAVLVDESLVSEGTAALVNDFYATVTVQKEPQQIGFALMYGEKLLFCLELESCGNGVCLHSNLLGEKPVHIAGNDLEPLVKRMMQYAVDNGLMTQEESDAALANMEAMKQPAEVPAQPEESALTAEEQQLIEALAGIDATPLMEQLFALDARIDIVEDNVEQPGSDKAVKRIQAAYSGEDLKQLLQAVIQTVESSDALVALLASAGLPLKDESFRSVIDETIGQLAAAVKSLGFSMYLGEDGGVVHMSSMPVFVSEGNEVTGSISYKRSTLADGKRYTLDIGAGMQPAEGEYAVLFDGTLMLETHADGGKLSFKTGDQEVVATITSTTGVQDGGEYSVCQIAGELLSAGESAGKVTISLEAYDLSALTGAPSCSHLVTLSLNDGEPCVSLLSVTNATEPAASFSSEGTAEPMALSDEEFSAFMNGVIENVGTWANDMAETFSGAAQQAN